MTKMLNDNQYKAWPIISIAWLAIRKGILSAAPQTWYKYVKILGITRAKSKSRRKKRDIGIRASKPNQIWHADLTIFRPLDNVKAYIYFIIDNYSRYILAWKVSLKYSASIVFENLKKAYFSAIQTSMQIKKPIPHVDLIVDGGSENNNRVIEDFLALPEITVKKIIAQKDIIFSNSMIEAVNKLVKYRHLYLHDFDALQKHLHSFILIYNNERPHCSINGLTPLEAYKGKSMDKNKITS
jgi:putative transposase